MRRRRLRWLVDLMRDLPEPVRILDVGGTAIFWRNNRDLLVRKHHITVLNLTASDSNSADIAFVAGDARAMPYFQDGEFDLCFSNSVIEHVGALEDQLAMAREIRRVAVRYFVQTPSRYFPLEPHFLVPFWQFLPVPLRAALLAKFKIGWMDRQPSYKAARAEVEQIRLLSVSEMRRLFPGSTIKLEKLGGLTKSIVAMGSAAS